jgi:hypothetical protein
MRLARISPGPSGYDLRTFECSKCEHILKEMIATDPMKSDKAGWLAGELKKPGMRSAFEKSALDEGR